MAQITGVFVRFSDLPIDQPIQIVIKDLRTAQLYKFKYVLLDAQFPYAKGKDFQIIFPLSKFKHEYLKFPRSMRMEIGDTNILMEVIKQPFGRLEIVKITKFK